MCLKIFDTHSYGLITGLCFLVVEFKNHGFTYFSGSKHYIT